MPFRTEHACRIREPRGYVRMRRQNRRIKGRAVAMLFGVKRDGKSELQSVRFPVGSWSESEARAVCKELSGRFEAIMKSASPMAEVLKAAHAMLRKQWAGLNDQELRQEIRQHLQGRRPFKDATKYGDAVHRLFSDHAIARSDDGRLWRVDITENENAVKLGAPAEVREEFVAVKALQPPAATVQIVKADDEKQIVYGVVMEPDETDLQNDRTGAGEIEKAAHHYMREGADVHIQHGARAYEDATVVENYIAPTDLELGGQAVKAGSWVMGVHIPHPEIWGLVKAGKLTGFSPRGTAVRQLVHA